MSVFVRKSACNFTIVGLLVASATLAVAGEKKGALSPPSRFENSVSEPQGVWQPGTQMVDHLPDATRLELLRVAERTDVGSVPSGSVPGCPEAAVPAGERSPIVLAFLADWCGPCKKMRPALDRLAAEGRLRIVNIDVQRAMVKLYKLTELPTLVAVDGDGQEVERRVGFLSDTNLRRFLDGLPSQPEPRFPQPYVPRGELSPSEPCPAIAAELPGAVRVEPLLRVTYAVPRDTAAAFVAFLEEHAAAEFQADVQEQTLRITATCEVHAALAPFLHTVLSTAPSTEGAE